MSCSLKQPGISHCPRPSLSCLTISLVKILEVAQFAFQITIGNVYKVSISLEVFEILFVGSLEAPFCCKVALLSHSSLVLLLTSLLPPFISGFYVLSQSSDYTIFFSAGIPGPVLVSLSTDCRENIFSTFYPLLSYLSSQLSYPLADITQWTIRLLTPPF